MSNPIMQFFDYGHLAHADLREVSANVCALAERMEALLLNGPEKSAGLRKLLEAKDCFVRAALQKPVNVPVDHPTTVVEGGPVVADPPYVVGS